MAKDMFKRTGDDGIVLGAYLTQIKGNLSETRRPEVGGSAGKVTLLPGQGPEPGGLPEYYKRDPKYSAYVTKEGAHDSGGHLAGGPPPAALPAAPRARSVGDRFSASQPETDDAECDPVDMGSNDVVRHDWIKASDEKFVALGVYV
jgi:hypothetical protein